MDIEYQVLKDKIDSDLSSLKYSRESAKNDGCRVGYLLSVLDNLESNCVKKDGIDITAVFRKGILNMINDPVNSPKRFKGVEVDPSTFLTLNSEFSHKPLNILPADVGYRVVLSSDTGEDVGRLILRKKLDGDMEVVFLELSPRWNTKVHFPEIVDDIVYGEFGFIPYHYSKDVGGLYIKPELR